MTGLRRALWALAAAGVVLGLAVLALMVTSDYVDTPGVWAAGVLLAGWGFIGVGLYAWGRRPDNGVGLLMTATGFAWLVAAAGFSDLPLVFTLAQLLGTVFFAVVLHLLLAFPSGRLQSVAERRLVGAAYFVTTVSPSRLTPSTRRMTLKVSGASSDIQRNAAKHDQQHRARCFVDPHYSVLTDGMRCDAEVTAQVVTR
jgi:hypothetical protein